MPPTPSRTNDSFTSSRSSFFRLAVTASSEPVTSALMMRLSVAASPAWIWREDVLELGAAVEHGGRAGDVGEALVVLALLGDLGGRALVLGDHEVVTGGGDVGEAEDLHRRGRAGRLDLLALVVDEGPDPAPGGTGDERVADLEGAALHEHRGDGAAARDRAWLRARRPWPGPSGLARRSSSSATTSRLSSSSSIPMPWRAEIWQTIVSPPQDSGTRPRSASWARTLSGSALSRSILLTATTIGTSAARAWSMASMVWGITPSSAATTSTTMSVASAPRARMAVNASWPGVSMKVMALPSLIDLVRTDVLGDAAGLAGDHVGVADAVEQLGLAVVDVTHDGDDRGARLGGLLVVLIVELARRRAPSGARPLAPHRGRRGGSRRRSRRRTARSCRRSGTGWP